MHISPQTNHNQQNTQHETNRFERTQNTNETILYEQNPTQPTQHRTEQNLERTNTTNLPHIHRSNTTQIQPFCMQISNT